MTSELRDQFDPSDHSHRRYNPLTGDWVLVSPHRSKRPWLGINQSKDETPRIAFDQECHLCPGNIRKSGEVNPDYTGTLVFENDYSPFSQGGQPLVGEIDPLMRVQRAYGVSRVICYSPHHGNTLSELSHHSIMRVIETWCEEVADLARDFVWVQVFENKGPAMGSSQPHPHGQIWATNFLPTEVTRKEHHLKDYYQTHGSNLLLDYVKSELDDGRRVVVSTDHWLAVVPYWAAWPFETLLLPKSHVERFDALNLVQKQDLCSAIRELTIRYDNLFSCRFPYSMGWHFAPFTRSLDGTLTNGDHWQLHAVFNPVLLLSATHKKFMVGFEMFGESQRDFTPEYAAKCLRDLSTNHYLSRSRVGD